jgi:hypothetical protein
MVVETVPLAATDPRAWLDAGERRGYPPTSAIV